MMNYHIGDSFQYIAAQYAKSNRSACRQCKQKIPKDELRLGILLDDDHYAASYWYHVKCFHFKPRHKILDVQTLEQKIYGTQDLKKNDLKELMDYLTQELTNLKENKSGRKKAKKSQSKAKSQSNKSQSKSVSPDQKKVKKSGKKIKKEIVKKFMSTAQTKKLNQISQEYNKLSTNQLKQLLQKNGQAKSGTKEQLVSKCADGKMFGRIPMCSKCGGGKLRFDNKTGNYKCPGYMEDTDFVHCSATFTFDQIKRQEWLE